MTRLPRMETDSDGHGATGGEFRKINLYWELVSIHHFNFTKVRNVDSIYKKTLLSSLFLFMGLSRLMVGKTLPKISLWMATWLPPMTTLWATRMTTMTNFRTMTILAKKFYKDLIAVFWKKMGIADDSTMEDTVEGDHIYKASIFEILRASKPSSHPPTLDLLLKSPDVSTFYKKTPTSRIWLKGPLANCFQGERGIVPL